MEKNEKDKIEQLEHLTDNIKIPEKLNPDNVEELLKGQSQKKKSRTIPYIASVAAVLAVVLVSAFALQNRTGTKKEAVDNQNNKKNTTAVEVEPQIALAQTYSDVYEKIKNNTRADLYTKEDEAGMVNDAKADTSTASNSGAQAKAYSDGYSETNVRQEGVGEGDTVKTDGTYLYTLNENAAEIGIISTENDTLKKIQTVKLESGAQIAEFYVEENRLIVLYNVSPEMQGGIYLGENTKVSVFDLTEPDNPKELGTITQSGRFNTSRLVDGYLYTFSDFSVYQECKKEDVQMYIPQVNESSLEAKNICMPVTENASQYKVVTGMKLSDPTQILDSKAILSNGGMCYVSNENIYACDTLYDDNGNRTVIRKLSYQDGMLTVQVQGEVQGTLNDSFSIDEYDGNLRLVTTLNQRQIIMLRADTAADTAAEEETQAGNALYVLNEQLQTVGKIVDIAPGETVKSARFMGETGYFVTFKNTDPLFSVDLSSPEEPKIIGTLKIPGFSEYLHPYGEGRLLGIGMEMDEAGMTMEGVKLSMFDISDPSDVKEEKKEILKNTYSSSAVQDYRNVLINQERNIIGFGADGNTEQYYIYSYTSGEGFTCKLKVDMGTGSYMSAKGVYIGTKLYIVKGNVIQLYSLESYEKLDDLVL